MFIRYVINTSSASFILRSHLIRNQSCESSHSQWSMWDTDTEINFQSALVCGNSLNYHCILYNYAFIIAWLKQMSKT